MILHVDMDAFFAAVEQRDNPDLQGKPIVVGGTGPRGVVSTASYEARAYGCHSAQPTAVARRRCPDLIVVPGRHRHYIETSRHIFRIFGNYTPEVQPLSIDEAFLDVTGSIRALGSPEKIAADIRRDIRSELNLTASVGVAPNMFLAKLASSHQKPDGLTVVPDDVLGWLDPQDIRRMWGVGPKMAERLHRIGVETFGDLRRLPDDMIQAQFGQSGLHIHDLANGRDPRRVHSDATARQISHEQTFHADLVDLDEIRAVLLRQTEDVARRLRHQERDAAGITVKFRTPDFQTTTRSSTFRSLTHETRALWEAVSAIFDEWRQSRWHPVRLVGVSARVATGDGSGQGLLFGQDERDREASVDGVSDAINARFGSASIRRAAAIRTRADSLDSVSDKISGESTECRD